MVSHSEALSVWHNVQWPHDISGLRVTLSPEEHQFVLMINMYKNVYIVCVDVLCNLNSQKTFELNELCVLFQL